MNIEENIRRKLDTLTDSEQAVARFLLSTSRPVQSMSITKLAEASGTSVAAVQRFCQSMDFRGYRDFKNAYSSYQLTAAAAHHPQTMDRFLENYHASISDFSSVDQDVLDQLIRALTDGQPNHLHGLYYSSLAARYLAMGLNDLGCSSTAHDTCMDLGRLSGITREDSTVVLFSVRGEQQIFLQFGADFFQSPPQNTFLITMNPNARLAAFVPHTILLPGLDLANRLFTDPLSIEMLFIERLLNQIYGSSSRNQKTETATSPSSER